jgi:hypothetical protein
MKLDDDTVEMSEMLSGTGALHTSATEMNENTVRRRSTFKT